MLVVLSLCLQQNLGSPDAPIRWRSAGGEARDGAGAQEPFILFLQLAASASITR
jgi:hypothetical protein